MAVKIRLQRKGRKKAPFYFIVVADARAPRDGRFIEKIGTYNPLTVPATIHLDNERAFAWLNNGAQPTDTVNAILRFKGVLYQKHLTRGVRKGALTEEQAAAELVRWIEQKEAGIAQRREATKEKKIAQRTAADGTPKAKAKPAPAPVIEEPVTEEAAEEAVTTTAEAVESTEAVVAVAEEAIAEETAAEEAVTEEAVVPEAEAPVVAETPVEEAAPETTESTEEKTGE